MISLTDKERLEVLGEVFTDELQVIREYLSDIPVIKKKIEKLESVAEEHSQLLHAHSYEFSLIRKGLRSHDARIEANTQDIAWIKQKLA